MDQETTSAGPAVEAPDSADSSDQFETARFCQWCGDSLASGDSFCRGCGRPVQPSASAERATGETGRDAHDSFPAGWPPEMYGADGPPAGSSYPPLPYGSPYPAPPSGAGTSRNLGLILGLIATAIAAIGAIVAVVLLASSGGGQAATIATATAAAAPVTTQTQTTARPTPKHHRRRHKATPTQPSVVTVTSTAAVPAPAVSNPTPSQSGQAQAASASDAAAARATVEHHWQLVGQGDYNGAFDLFAPAYQGSVGRSSWISDKNVDRPAVSGLDVGSAQITSDSTASVQLISLHTVGQEAPQCHNWTGSYDLTKVDGAWLISHANLSGTTC